MHKVFDNFCDNVWAIIAYKASEPDCIPDSITDEIMELHEDEVSRAVIAALEEAIGLASEGFHEGVNGYESAGEYVYVSQVRRMIERYRKARTNK